MGVHLGTRNLLKVSEITANISEMVQNRDIVTHARARARARAFNGPFSGTTRVSRYQKGETNLDFTGARDSEWQWL